jgi:uncharacterized protein (DUF305 family)
MRAVTIRITAGLAALATATVVSSCAGTSSSNEHAAVHEHNATDVAFAQNMIPHHQQAVDMSAMVPSHTANPDVIVIAKHISLDQQAEIEVLQELLVQWREPAASEHGGHEGHGGMGIDGMVDSATIARLQSLTGGEFDVLWLRSMISHHQGAVMMARPEIVHGQSPQAVKLAKIIVDWQQYEIARMSALVSVPE